MPSPREQSAPRWKPADVRTEHLRALTTLSERSVLVADPNGRLSVVTPEVAAEGAFAHRMRVLATRADLLDAGLQVSARAGRLIGPVVEVCSAEAASLTAAEKQRAEEPFA